MATKLPFVTLALLSCLAGCNNTPTPTTPTPTTPVGPTTVTWSTQLGPRGTVSRSIEPSAAGTVTVTLNSMTPVDRPVGLSIGIPRAGGSGCLPTLTVQTASSSTPQIETRIANGTYCVQVYDLGTLEAPVTFTAVIALP